MLSFGLYKALYRERPQYEIISDIKAPSGRDLIIAVGNGATPGDLQRIVNDLPYRRGEEVSIQFRAGKDTRKPTIAIYGYRTGKWVFDPDDG